jgi:hypothetical protein
MIVTTKAHHWDPPSAAHFSPFPIQFVQVPFLHHPSCFFDVFVQTIAYGTPEADVLTELYSFTGCSLVVTLFGKQQHVSTWIDHCQAVYSCST